MNRYIRQTILEQIGKSGQEKLSKSKVAIIGVGALGSMSAELLYRAGIGEILLIDKDKVDLVNLQRQHLFDEKDVGKYKVEIAKKKLNQINSDVKINIVNEFIDDKNINKNLKNYNLILDCTDNMKTRHIINNYCEKTKKVWIYSAAVGVEGNVLILNNKKYSAFRRIFKSAENFDNCQNVGVVNTITTIISSIQVTEALKIILGKNKDVCRDLIRINAWTNSYERMKLS